MFYENYCKSKTKIEKNLTPKNLDLVSPLCPLSDSSCGLSHQPLMIYYYRDPEGTQPCHSVKVMMLVETLSGSGAALTNQGNTLNEVNHQPADQVGIEVLENGWYCVNPPLTHSQQSDSCFYNICKAGPTLGIHSPWKGAFTKIHLAQAGFCFSSLVGERSPSEGERRSTRMSKLWSQRYPGCN